MQSEPYVTKNEIKTNNFLFLIISILNIIVHNSDFLMARAIFFLVVKILVLKVIICHKFWFWGFQVKIFHF